MPKWGWVALTAIGLGLTGAPVPVGAADASCASDSAAEHTACIDADRDRITGVLRNDSGTTQSCGTFRLNFFARHADGSEADVRDEYRSACLAPGKAWTARFVPIGGHHPGTIMCVRGFLQFQGGQRLLTGAACDRLS